MSEEQRVAEKVEDLVRDAFYEGCRDMQSWNGTLGPMSEDEVWTAWQESNSLRQLMVWQGQPVSSTDDRRTPSLPTHPDEALAKELREYADYRATPDALSRLLWRAADRLDGQHRT